MTELDFDELRNEMRRKLSKFLTSFSSVIGLKELDLHDIKETYERGYEDLLNLLDDKINYGY